LKDIEEYTFSFDAQSKLSPILQIKKVNDYNPKLIQQVKMKTEILSNHQNNLMQLQESLKNIQKGTVQLNEINFSQTGNQVTYTLKDAIDKMLDESRTISNELNQIPDS
jgi:peptidoglycan hydrolase CwlO-like protein